MIPLTGLLTIIPVGAISSFRIARWYRQLCF